MPPSTSAIRRSIYAAAEQGRKAMGLFVTSGFPEPEATLPILHALDEGGADFLELGMPFSDPLGEGLPIQRSSERALAQGIRMRDTFRTVESFRSGSDTPVLLMGYINPIFRYGVEAFCRDADSAGVDGLILPDLPPEENGIIVKAADAVSLALVNLIAPNTPPERIRSIDRATTGFVYAVSITGLTGSGLESMEAIDRYLERARGLVSENPLLVGFGIKGREDAARLTRHTDGFIVGSALIREIGALWDDESLGEEDRLERIRAFVSVLGQGDEVAAARG